MRTIVRGGGDGGTILTGDGGGAIATASRKSFTKKPKMMTSNTNLVGRLWINAHSLGCFAFRTSARPCQSKYSRKAKKAKRMNATINWYIEVNMARIIRPLLCEI